MSTNNTIAKYDCVGRIPVICAVVNALLASPFHIFMLRIPIARLRLVLPRHKILLSLSISDSLQLLVSAVPMIISFAVNLESTSKSCNVIRKIIEINALFTVVAASGSIVALSIERYIACVYSLRFYVIVTNKRVKTALVCIWSTGLLCGFASTRYDQNSSGYSILRFSKTKSIIYMVTILASTLVLVIIQIRLYVISRKKLRVESERSFGSKREENDLRKRQLKLTAVSTAVVGLYVVCMLPLACFTAYNFRKFSQGNEDNPLRRALLIALAQVNTFFNPFIYGLGMADTRRAIKRDFNILKTYFISKFGSLN